MFFDRVKIEHPEWLPSAHYAWQGTYDLYSKGKLPDRVAGQMLVVSMKRLLRCIYSTNQSAALHLLWDCLSYACWEIKERLAKYFYAPRWALAWLWTMLWGYTRKVRRIPCAFMWGRHESPEPLFCGCGWAGPRRWATHGYQDDGSGEDVEPCDECPRCGAEI